jgi:hypothetical protein
MHRRCQHCPCGSSIVTSELVCIPSAQQRKLSHDSVIIENQQHQRGPRQGYDSRLRSVRSWDAHGAAARLDTVERESEFRLRLESAPLKAPQSRSVTVRRTACRSIQRPRHVQCLEGRCQWIENGSGSDRNSSMDLSAGATVCRR